MMQGAGQLAGETLEQQVARLESELDDAQDRLDSAERVAELEAERARRIADGESAAERERDFLRDQLTDLQQQIASPSAPRTRGEMARLIAGLLRGEDWRYGTWR